MNICQFEVASFLSITYFNKKKILCKLLHLLFLPLVQIKSTLIKLNKKPEKARSCAARNLPGKAASGENEKNTSKETGQKKWPLSDVNGVTIDNSVSRSRV